MNKTISHSIALFIILAATCLPASAQIRLGVRAGMTIDKMRFDRSIVDSDNRIGYTAGLVLDFNIPIVGLGAEVSAMYTHHNNRLAHNGVLYKRNLIDIPIHVRYRLSLPVVERVVAPFVFTGPSFSILFNENKTSTIQNNKTYMSWDVGGGVDLFTRLRLSASYAIGVSKALEYVDTEYSGETIKGKERYWTLTAAYMF